MGMGGGGGWQGVSLMRVMTVLGGIGLDWIVIGVQSRALFELLDQALRCLGFLSFEEHSVVETDIGLSMAVNEFYID